MTIYLTSSLLLTLKHLFFQEKAGGKYKKSEVLYKIQAIDDFIKSTFPRNIWIDLERIIASVTLSGASKDFKNHFQKDFGLQDAAGFVEKKSMDECLYCRAKIPHRTFSLSSSLFLLKPVCLLPTIHCVHNKQPVTKKWKGEKEKMGLEMFE